MLDLTMPLCLIRKCLNNVYGMTIEGIFNNEEFLTICLYIILKFIYMVKCHKPKIHQKIAGIFGAI